NDHTNHDYDDPDKEVSHRRGVASGFLVQELKRSVERKKLHHDTRCDDAGRDHTAPRPLSWLLEVPESNEGERKSQEDGDGCDKPLPVALRQRRFRLLRRISSIHHPVKHHTRPRFAAAAGWAAADTSTST